MSTIRFRVSESDIPWGTTTHLVTVGQTKSANGIVLFIGAVDQEGKLLSCGENDSETNKHTNIQPSSTGNGTSWVGGALG